MKNKKELEAFLQEECKLMPSQYYILVERFSRWNRSIVVFYVNHNKLNRIEMGEQYYNRLTMNTVREKFSDLLEPTPTHEPTPITEAEETFEDII